MYGLVLAGIFRGGLRYLPPLCLRYLPRFVGPVSSGPWGNCWWVSVHPVAGRLPRER